MAITVPAKVSQKNLAKFGTGHFRKGFGSALIRKVTLPSHDALFEMPGPRGLLEQILVVVRFNHQKRASFESLPHQAGYHPDIGDESDLIA
jgi:hypothetical protein